MSFRTYDAEGVLREIWDDATRTYRTYDPAGVQLSTRPYTTEENARAVAEATQLTEATNKGAIEANIVQDLAAMQTIIDTANATINASPASYIKDIARAIRRLDRMALAKFDGVN
jgi:malic enzyme